jgi:hypothetical protein
VEVEVGVFAYVDALQFIVLQEMPCPLVAGILSGDTRCVAWPQAVVIRDMSQACVSAGATGNESGSLPMLPMLPVLPMLPMLPAQPVQPVLPMLPGPCRSHRHHCNCGR